MAITVIQPLDISHMEVNMHSDNNESNSLRHGEQRWTFVAEAEASSSSSSTSNSNDQQSFECELMSENDTATAITDNEKEKKYRRSVFNCYRSTWITKSWKYMLFQCGYTNVVQFTILCVSTKKC